jgi:hypothetical protein
MVWKYLVEIEITPMCVCTHTWKANGQPDLLIAKFFLDFFQYGIARTVCLVRNRKAWQRSRFKGGLKNRMDSSLSCSVYSGNL